MSLEDLLFPENAALSWLPPPSIKGQFVSFLKPLLPCLDLGAPGYLGRAGLPLYIIGCLYRRENYKQIKLHKLKIQVPMMKSGVTE